MHWAGTEKDVHSIVDCPNHSYEDVRYWSIGEYGFGVLRRKYLERLVHAILKWTLPGRDGRIFVTDLVTRPR